MAIDKSKYTPMLQQYLSIKEDYNDAIVFFRLGDFYEMFFEDALLASRELEIQLTARDGGTKDRIPMCGVPHHSSESYLSRLVEKGYKVAICEQTEEPGPGKKLVRREVVRVVTPGTNIDDADAGEQFIGAVGLSEFFYTITYLNLSTGELYTLKIPKDRSTLVNELSAMSLKELVLSHAFDLDYIKPYTDHENIVISIHGDTAIDETFAHLYEHLPTPYEQKTVKRLLSYIMKTQKRRLLHIKEARPIESSATMRMDANTIRHLELTRTMLKNVEKGSLFWLIDHTSTAMGGRFLKRQLLRPLLNKDILEKRYDFIDALNREFIVAADLREALKSVYDLERIVGRISYGNTNGKDLVQLRKSLAILPDFKTLLTKLDLPYATFLSESVDTLEDTHKELQYALKDEQPLTIKEGGMFKKGYDKTLDELRDIHLNISHWLEKLQEKEREKTGIKKLKVGYNRVFGYYIEVPKSQTANIKDEYGYTRKQTLANAERYITEDLKEKEKIILSSEEKSIKQEYALFVKLRDRVREKIAPIQKNAETLSEVDMFLSFAKASETLNLKRPVLIDSHEIEIIDSRHPIVEKMLEETFIPNDVHMDSTTDILLITGPNMSGKSTYMRQLAITAILAQIGAFVPAGHAKLPIFDQLFTRIGASDDLISGKSTFMVEMLDANHAIKNATKNSLILFDEIGRGTSTYDGMAIAQAIIEYIHEKIGAKTLFSTHYHELTNLERDLERLKNVHVAAEEVGGSIKFHHLVKPGKADRSYGINVAELADLPKSLITRSKTILKHLEDENGMPDTLESVNLFSLAEQEEASHPLDEIAQSLRNTDCDELRPIDALSLLYELKEKLKNRN